MFGSIPSGAIRETDGPCGALPPPMTHDLASFLRALALAGVLPSLACIDAPGTDTETTTSGTSTSDSETGTSSAATDSSGMHDSSSADGGSTDATGALDPCATAGWGAEPMFEKPPGRFTFRDAPGYQWLTGFISDGARVDFHQEREREGACRRLTYTASNCDPACTPPAVCIAETCITEPLGLSAGVVTLAGVGDETIELTEDPLHSYFWDREGDYAVAMPSLGAAGADVDAFELAACPTTAPTPIGDWSGLLAARAPGEAVTLTWSDPVDTARIYLRMTTGIGTHGGISPVEIECEGPDVGMLELPGAYLDALYADGWSCGECGGNNLVRYHVDETDAGGTAVQLRTEATAGFWFIP
jgi:hypothetical protein